MRVLKIASAERAIKSHWPARPAGPLSMSTRWSSIECNAPNPGEVDLLQRRDVRRDDPGSTVAAIITCTAS
jgi:hypothetical protein